MTVRDVYIGELGPDGSLDWGGNPAHGNIARRTSPFFPAGARANSNDILHDWIRRGALEGRQVDWGAIAAKATVAQLQAFVADCYGAGVPAEIAQFLAGLDPSRAYALIGCEY